MFVLLSFNDDEVAKEFVRDQLAIEELDGGEGGHKVEGIYKKPTLFCNIMDPIHGSRRITGFTKGQKWGWWVCAVCKKPRKLAIDNLPKEVCGFNLLDRLFPATDTDFI